MSKEDALENVGSRTPSPSPPPPPSPPLEPLSESNGSVDSRLDRSNKLKDECLNFLVMVNKRLKNSEKFKEFLDLVLKYRHDKDTDRLDREVYIMFKDMPELYTQFTRFLISKEEEESSMMTQRPNPYRYFNKRKIR